MLNYVIKSALECGMWNGKFHIPIPIPEFWNVECGIVLLRMSHSNHAEVLVHWNVECGMVNSTFQFLFQNFGMWNVDFSF